MSTVITPKYGLPTEIKFCQRCVISNQRPNSAMEFKHTIESQKQTIAFNQENVCDACLVAERKKYEINWQEREDKLRILCDQHRSKNGDYDCLVPGSGGKDSFYAAHILKYRYGMHPLTVTWAPHLYTPWGWKNFQSWIHAGFDNYLMTPNGLVHRLLTRLAVEKLFHPFQPFMMGQKAFPPKMALKHHISLVFYGENEVEYGNPIQENESPQRKTNYFTADDASSLYLGGVSVKSLKEDYGLTDVDLSPYFPATSQATADLQVHYLGYYLPWRPQAAYYYAVENGHFQPSPERTPGTYSKYNSIDDKIDDFHYYTTYIKFGIGRATYDAAQEVRNEEITREEAVALVKKFDGEFPERFAEEIFAYLSINPKEFPKAHQMFSHPTMTRDYFMQLTDQFRSPHLWRLVDGQWQLRHRVFD